MNSNSTLTESCMIQIFVIHEQVAYKLIKLVILLPFCLFLGIKIGKYLSNFVIHKTNFLLLMLCENKLFYGIACGMLLTDDSFLIQFAFMGFSV